MIAWEVRTSDLSQTIELLRALKPHESTSSWRQAGTDDFALNP